MAKRYTKQERDLALRLYQRYGPAEASRRLAADYDIEVRPDTISQWANRAGIVGTHVPERAAYVLARKLSWAERKLQLADEMGAAADEALQVLRARITEATPAQAAQILGTLVDKTQLLTGGATGRMEHSNLDAEIERLAAEIAASDPRVPAPVETEP